MAGADEVVRVARPHGTGSAELVHAFHSQMPTGVTVSDDGRIFVCYPRWGDRVEFTVAELRDGREIPYPGADVNVFDETRPRDCLVSVQSVVVDPAGRLWLLDTGSIELGPRIDGGAKLVCVDLARDAIVRTIVVPADVALENTYLNDIRFDLRRGEAGVAFITDSSNGEGEGGLIVVDLASGECRRRLHDHPTVRVEPGFLAIIGGHPVAGLAMASDGIAIGAGGERLFYCPFGSRRLYSVAVDALADPSASDEEIAATVADHGEKGASDGLESDAEGRVYATNYEHGAILRRDAGGTWETLVHQPELLFVDTLSLAGDGHLYFTVNQLHRQPSYNDGQDLREPPYAVMRTPVDARPVRLVAG
jgi:sugar lactone lactonase YvrE